MVREVHNKLVRDKIPEIIEADGKQRAITRVLNQQELDAASKDKVYEELEELFTDRNESEAGDVLEAFENVLGRMGISMQAANDAKEKKRADRGGFEKGVFLEAVEDV